MKFYYASPQPERFVEEVRLLAAAPGLDNPGNRFTVATFLGRVMATHPERMGSWLEALGDL